MPRAFWLTLLVLLTGVGSAALAASPAHDVAGNLRVPESYTSWALMGTWVVAGKDGGTAGIHTVYTQPETIRAYRETGEFPDGAVLVKELRKTETGKMTTGTASWAAEIDGWFVMVKDLQGRHPDSGLWGDGWGWAFFEASNPRQTTTQSYSGECIGCHIPAKSTDWVYIKGYPVLARE